MELSKIDNMALNGESVIHKSSVISKLFVTLMLILSIVVSNDLIKLGIILLIVLLLIKLSKISLKKALHFTLYPVFFTLIFALIYSQNGLYYGLTVIFKATTSALTMVFLITTTPYVDVFSVFSLFMPKVLVDIFFFTYRSFFILLEKLSNLQTNIKLRGGYHPIKIFKNMRIISSLLGTLIIQSFEMSERMYRIYSIRGYNGKMPVRVDLKINKVSDIALILFGIIIFIGMVIPWKI